MSLERMFDVVEGLRETASADAAFGEPQEAEGRVFIPVAAVGTGFGMGFGQGTAGAGEEEGEEGQAAEEAAEDEGGLPSGEGGGAGGKAHSRPVAVIEVTPEETIIRPIIDESKVALAGVMLVGWVLFCMMVTLRAIFAPRA